LFFAHDHTDRCNNWTDSEHFICFKYQRRLLGVPHHEHADDDAAAAAPRAGCGDAIVELAPPLRLGSHRMMARDNCHQLESSPVRQQQIKAAAHLSL
jgi:hypothetical protein